MFVVQKYLFISVSKAVSLYEHQIETKINEVNLRIYKDTSFHNNPSVFILYKSTVCHLLVKVYDSIIFIMTKIKWNSTHSMDQKAGQIQNERFMERKM